MKKTISIILVLTILLLSGCELAGEAGVRQISATITCHFDTPQPRLWCTAVRYNEGCEGSGKNCAFRLRDIKHGSHTAISSTCGDQQLKVTGNTDLYFKCPPADQPIFIPAHQCKTSHFHVWDRFYNLYKECESMDSEYEKRTSYFLDKPVPGYEMALATQCAQQKEETAPLELYDKGKHTFTDRFVVIGDCPKGTYKDRDLGYVFKNPIPEYTMPIYKCSIDHWRHGAWDNWISLTPTCKWSGNGQYFEYSTDFLIGHIITKRELPKVTITECSKDIEENTNLKKEIATLQDEIAGIKRELETR